MRSADNTVPTGLKSPISSERHRCHYGQRAQLYPSKF